LAAATALAGEYMGARIVISDSGSGAPTPASVEMISAIKSQLTVPYFYGGGCKTPEQAEQIIKAGADGIQIGSAFENEKDVKKAREKIRTMVKAVKKVGEEKASGKIKLKERVKSGFKFPQIKFNIRKSWEFFRGRNKQKNGKQKNNKNDKKKKKVKKK